jgi:hypothetical protein
MCVARVDRDAREQRGQTPAAGREYDRGDQIMSSAHDHPYWPQAAGGGLAAQAGTHIWNGYAWVPIQTGQRKPAAPPSTLRTAISVCAAAIAALVGVAMGRAAVDAVAGGSQGGSAVHFTDPTGRFIADFPSQPTSIPLASAVQWQASDGSRAVDGVTYAPTRGRAADQVLAAGPDAFASGVSGTVQSRSQSTCAGHPCVDFVVVAPGGVRVNAREIVVDSTVFVIDSAGTDGSTDAWNSFVGSVTIAHG